MTRKSKKDGELDSVRANLALAAIDVDGGVIEDGERPDFTVSIAGARVGIEVTDYHVAGNRRQVEEHWATLRQWPMLLNDFPHHRHVELEFRALRLPSRRETHGFVRDVITITAATAELPATHVVDPVAWPVLGKYVVRVEIAASRVRYLGWTWNHDIAWVKVGEDELTAIVESKRSSVAAPASSHWLIVTEGATLSRVWRSSTMSGWWRCRG